MCNNNNKRLFHDNSWRWLDNSQHNDHLNSYSVSSDPLEIVPELTMDYSLNNPFDFLQCPWISWCPALGLWVALLKFWDYKYDYLPQKAQRWPSFYTLSLQMDVSGRVLATSSSSLSQIHSVEKSRGKQPNGKISASARNMQRMIYSQRCETQIKLRVRKRS